MADPLDELYAGPLETFVARRKELAAARKAAGDIAGAAAIKEAVKPTLSAWIVNQVAHHHPAVIRELLGATADVMRAQLDAGGGADDRGRYERTVAKQRAAEERLTDAVRAVGGEPSADLSRRVLENFRRGALSAETRQLLRTGRLTRDVELPDLGALLELGVGPGGAARREPEGRRRGTAEREVERRKAEAAERRMAEAAAEREAEAERRRKEAAARQEVDRAERQVARLRAELATAERELARVRAAAERG